MLLVLGSERLPSLYFSLNCKEHASCGRWRSRGNASQSSEEGEDLGQRLVRRSEASAVPGWATDRRGLSESSETPTRPREQRARNRGRAHDGKVHETSWYFLGGIIIDFVKNIIIYI